MDNLQNDNEEGAREEESQHGSIGEERRVDLCGMLLAGGVLRRPCSCRTLFSSRPHGFFVVRNNNFDLNLLLKNRKRLDTPASLIESKRQ